MSLVTRCPACATTFKVVRDQLRISDGWVRCGRCSEVFDATIELHDTSVPTPEPATAEPSSPAAIDRDVESEAARALQSEQPQARYESPPEAEEEAMRDEAEADFLDDEHESSNPDIEASEVADESTRDPIPLARVASDVHWPDPESLTLEDEGRIAVRPPLPPPLSFPDIDLSLSSPVAAPAPAAEPVRAESEAALAQDAATDVQLQKALRRAHAKSAKIAKAKAREQKEQAAAADAAPVILAASEPEPNGASPTDMPSLFGAEKTGSFWQRVAVRRSMVVLAMLAAVLLLGQWLYQERDLIVARQPAARPALASMCKLLGCEISALRQINDIKVDGASFARGKNDEGYQLSFTLRNAADVPLAMPAVELTLLDTQERAVVRRVLMPSEFGAPVVLPARAERAASLALKLTGPEVQALPPVAGFRLEALYP